MASCRQGSASIWRIPAPALTPLAQAVRAGARAVSQPARPRAADLRRGRQGPRRCARCEPWHGRRYRRWCGQPAKGPAVPARLCQPQRGGFRYFCSCPPSWQIAARRSGVSGHWRSPGAVPVPPCWRRHGCARPGKTRCRHRVLSTPPAAVAPLARADRYDPAGARISWPGSAGFVRGCSGRRARRPQVAAGQGFIAATSWKRAGSGFGEGPRQGDLAGLHRLSQHLQAVAVEFRQLVQEQDAAVGEGYLPGRGLFAAASQGRGAAVVRCAKGRRKYAVASTGSKKWRSASR